MSPRSTCCGQGGRDEGSQRLGGGRFRREARAVAGLRHPNVVTCMTSASQAGSRRSSSMELLHGATLREELRRAGRLDAARTVAVFRGVCGAVKRRNRHHLVHRDLKPENIFLTDGTGSGGRNGQGAPTSAWPAARGSDEAGEPDARCGRHGKSAWLVGTVGYISPEQLLGTPRSLVGLWRWPSWPTRR